MVSSCVGLKKLLRVSGDMSHRKFEAPRHGSLAFLPRKRCRRGRGRVGAWPKDDASVKPHLTGFMGFKAGMTHVVREIERPGSKLHKKDVVEAVTIVECPEMVVVGLVGLIETPHGLRTLTSVWAKNLSDDLKRKFYRRWYKSKKRAFTKHSANFDESEIEKDLKKIGDLCQVVRVIAHTQPSRTILKTKKAQIIEIQINGGANAAEKVKFGYSLFEQLVPVSTIFGENDMCDIVAINTGKGTQGVIKRWGVTRLPRKTHRGLRKVACIGAWHPARVGYQVARAGQMGYHHRTIVNKKIYRIGSGADPRGACTEFDVTEKRITPMGGFSKYPEVKNDFLMIKGSVTGPAKRCLTLRRSLHPSTSRKALEKPNLKFIDTSSKQGHGRFQTHEEKVHFFGPTKKSHGVSAA